jgi:hypothetical protein
MSLLRFGWALIGRNARDGYLLVQITHSFFVVVAQPLRSTGDHHLPEEMGRDLSRRNVCFWVQWLVNARAQP